MITKYQLITFLGLLTLSPFGSSAMADASAEESTIRIDTLIVYKLGADMEQLPDRVNHDQKSSEGFFSELGLKVNGVMSDNWHYHADMRGFAATSETSLTSDDIETSRTEKSSNTNSFVQLRRLWLRYGGLTDFPDEHLTIGLQRITSKSSLLWDADIESLAWRFSTTRFSFKTGIGEMFDTYRTNTELSRIDKDKLRLFAEASYDWKAYHEITLSSMYAEQNSDYIPEDIQSGAPDGINGEWLWFAASLSSNWTKRRSNSNLAYNLQWLGLTGQSDFRSEDDRVFSGHDISAWAVDAGVRYDVQRIPASFGLTYSQGSGGFDSDESNMFVQTGLHSNRSTFTGNRQYMFRFNEALRPDVTNLRNYSAFASCTLAKRYLLAGVLSWFERSDEELPIYRLSQPLELQEGSNDIGWGADISFRHQVNRAFYNIPVDYYRLRNSVFIPGDSFEDDSDSTAYSVFLEIVGTF